MFSCLRAAEDRLSDLLMRQAATVTSERVTLGDMAAFLGDRSIGGLLLVLALPMALPVPAPGISVIFGVPLIVISAQLALGYRRAWLPALLAQCSISRTAFSAIIDRMLPTLRRLERIVRPRAGWLAGTWTKVPVWHYLPGAGNHHHPARALGSCGAGNRHLRPRTRAHRTRRCRNRSRNINCGFRTGGRHYRFGRHP
jgi:hypothetical protein